MFIIINIVTTSQMIHLYYTKIDNGTSRKHNTCIFLVCVASTVLDKFVIQVRQMESRI